MLPLLPLVLIVVMILSLMLLLLLLFFLFVGLVSPVTAIASLLAQTETLLVFVILILLLLWSIGWCGRRPRPRLRLWCFGAGLRNISKYSWDKAESFFAIRKKLSRELERSGVCLPLLLVSGCAVALLGPAAASF